MVDKKDESERELEEKPSSEIELVAGETLPEEVPKEIEVDHSKLYVWIADSGNNRIQKFDENFEYILEVGIEGWGQDKFYWPEMIIAEPLGTILVVDTGNHCLKRYDDDGEFVLGFGFAGDFASANNRST